MIDYAIQVPYCTNTMYLDNELRKHWVFAELHVAAMFSKRGYAVSVPYSQQPYDLIVDSWNKLYRVQIKAGAIFNQRERKCGLGDRWHYYAALNRRKGSNCRDGGNDPTSRYTSADFDILCVVCTEHLHGIDETETYVIPVSKVLSPTGSGRLINQVHIKPFSTMLTRKDSREAGLRWEPYRNNFILE